MMLALKQTRQGVSLGHRIEAFFKGQIRAWPPWPHMAGLSYLQASGVRAYVYGGVEPLAGIVESVNQDLKRRRGDYNGKIAHSVARHSNGDYRCKLGVQPTCTHKLPNARSEMVSLKEDWPKARGPPARGPRPNAQGPGPGTGPTPVNDPAPDRRYTCPVSHLLSYSGPGPWARGPGPGDHLDQVVAVVVFNKNTAL